ncbi:hypothetical protein MXB_757, partial [Myxobolus squamalis]
YPLNRKFDKLLYTSSRWNIAASTAHKYLRFLKLNTKKANDSLYENLYIAFRITLKAEGLVFKYRRKLELSAFLDDFHEVSSKKKQDLESIIKILGLAYKSLRPVKKHDEKRNTLKTFIFLANSLKMGIEEDTDEIFSIPKIQELLSPLVDTFYSSKPENLELYMKGDKDVFNEKEISHIQFLHENPSRVILYKKTFESILQQTNSKY